MVTSVLDVEKDAVERLRRDLRAAASTLSDQEARFLVDGYYMIQEGRKRAGNQQRALEKNEEPHEILSWFFGQSEVLEGQIKAALEKYAASRPLGQWALSITGIGPVITAGLLAHIDFTRVTSAGDIWRFAGLDPTVRWGKGQKRPWNASLKRLCWIIGESFMKFRNFKGDFYGKFYTDRKRLEISRNLQGMFADQAEHILAAKNIGKTTEAYPFYAGMYRLPEDRIPAARAAWEEGAATIKTLLADVKGESGSGVRMLPPAHINERAKRYAVKLFLSHFFEIGYELTHGEKPPAPFVIAHMGHIDYIPPPNKEIAGL